MANVLSGDMSLSRLPIVPIMPSVDLLAHFVLVRGQVAPRPTNHEFLEFRLQARQVVGNVRRQNLSSVWVVIERVGGCPTVRRALAWRS